jgi:ABC-type nitrate/sulfonate/bicarbonate transport system permease component
VETAIAILEPAPRAGWRESDRLWSVVGLIVTIALWQLLAWGPLDRYLPTPLSIVRTLNDDRDLYPSNIRATLGLAVRGWIFGNIAATALGALAVAIPRLEVVSSRIAIATYTIPVIAIGPILKVTFDGNVPYAILAGIAVFFTTYVGTILGLRSADRAALDLIRALGGSSFTALRRVRVRAALPAYFAGLRISAPAAVLGAMVGEWFGANKGLGQFMVAGMANANEARTWGIALVATAVASAGYALIALASRVLTSWDEGSSSTALSQRSLNPVVNGLVSVIVLVAIWYGFLKIFDVDSFVGKTPRDVWRYLITAPEAGANRTVIFDALGVTLRDAGLGFVVGMVISSLVAISFVVWRPLERIFLPLAMSVRSVPVVAMIPTIALALGGRNLRGVVIIVTIVVFFPTLVLVSHGLRAVRVEALEVMTVYDASARATFLKVRLPSALPGFFAAARIAGPGSLVGATLAEWLYSGEGLGALILQSGTTSKYNQLWSASVILLVIAVVIYGVIGAIERVALARFGDIS